MDTYRFYTGECFDAHEFLGAQVEGDGVRFTTFAPAARGVCVRIGEPVQEIPMERVLDGNFWSVFVPGLKAGAFYEYRIYQADGQAVDHADPYGFGMELRPAHRSIVRDLGTYRFGDAQWMAARSDFLARPMNIYELHVGSWRKPGEGWYTYAELAEPLIVHLRESGYNYVEFMPLSEHPCDESWGYQNTGFFAPTSRYGSAEDLMYLVDKLHQAGIGVLLDFVPVHFAVDAYALARYDGTHLYEYPHSDVGVSEWGSCNFMHSRGEVRSFLQSAAHYWLSRYHFDGLRMDAISRIIYWQGDERRGVNGNAVSFIQTMNRGLKALDPGCLLMAEDSTNYPGITKPVEEGGLGFDFKWNMGWMNDTLAYFRLPPGERTQAYHKLTFSMMYYYGERYLLPLSHDEVVHGKATIAQKMYGEYEDKFPQARTLYLYMMLHPGRKLNFMGNEIAQLREWDEKREQDWNLRGFPIHDAFYRFMRELNALYLAYPALWAQDYDTAGFCWADCHQEERCLYAMVRMAPERGAAKLLAVFNFSDTIQEDYALQVAEVGCKFVLKMDTEWEKYNGQTPETEEVLEATESGKVLLTLPRYSGKLYEMVE